MSLPTQHGTTQLLGGRTSSSGLSPENVKNIGNISLSSLGVMIGFGAFLSGLHYNSIHTGIWGFTAASFAAFCLHLAVLDKLGLIDKWYSAQMLSNIVKLGILILLAGFAGTIVYIVVTLVGHHGTTEKTGFYLSTVGAFLTFCYGLYLAIFAWRLKVKLERQEASLLHGVQPYPDC